MIQRIQTVWWTTSAILLLAFGIMPLFEFIQNNNSITVYTKDVNYLYGPVIGEIILTFITILLFKKRKIQIVLGIIMVINLIAIGFGIFVHYKTLIESYPDTTVIPLGVLMLLLAVILQIFAIRAVKKDEALIKSMDRLR